MHIVHELIKVYFTTSKSIDVNRLRYNSLWWAFMIPAELRKERERRKEKKVVVREIKEGNSYERQMKKGEKVFALKNID